MLGMVFWDGADVQSQEHERHHMLVCDVPHVALANLVSCKGKGNMESEKHKSCWIYRGNITKRHLNAAQSVVPITSGLIAECPRNTALCLSERVAPCFELPAA